MKNKNEILNLLKQNFSPEAGIRILYAAEVGSRAYGYNSVESDFDVRFVYYHESPRKYLDLRGHSECLERKCSNNGIITQDMVGYDIKKFLKLLMKANPSIYEWLTSPQIYYVSPVFYEYVSNIYMLSYKDKKPLFLANNQTAFSVYNKEIKKKKSKQIKDYLFVIKCILICLHILEFPDRNPPIRLTQLLDNLNYILAAGLNGHVPTYIKILISARLDGGCHTITNEDIKSTLDEFIPHMIDIFDCFVRDNGKDYFKEHGLTFSDKDKLMRNSNSLLYKLLKL